VRAEHGATRPRRVRAVEPLLADETRFREVRVDPVLGTLVWPGGADVDPDVLLGVEQPGTR
jgi:hypothetical protein